MFTVEGVSRKELEGRSTIVQTGGGTGSLGDTGV